MHAAATERNYARLHRIGVALCVLTFMLIVWGGHVNTTRSGMAFPDWPTSNAAPMVTYAPSEWLMQGDRFWEHGHRLLASLVGLVTVILGVGIYRTLPASARPNKMIVGLMAVVLGIIVTAIVGFNNMPSGMMETFMIVLAVLLGAFLVRAARSNGDHRLMWLALAAFVGVCLQGAFGGYTVRNNLPDWTSTSHGMLAEFFFMIVLGITMLTSQRWRTAERADVPVSAGVRTLITTTWGITFLQFFLGALTRHTDAWGVSVTWPQWSDDAFFPSQHMLQHAQVVIHLAHRTLAYVVAILVVWQWIAVMRARTQVPALVKTTSIGAALVGVQILLGALILWTARGEIATTLHVMTGVLLLLLMTITMYNAHRLYHFGGNAQVVPGGSVAGQGTR